LNITESDEFRNASNELEDDFGSDSDDDDDDSDASLI
jgi:hypothetical protein